jgi:hypothetical protein
MAVRDRTLRASVFSVTRRTSQPSKAWVSMRSFAWVLTAVRCASSVSHVDPISTASACSAGRCRGLPGGGHVQRSMFMKRVEPRMRWLRASRVTNGIDTPRACSHSPSWT